MSRRVLLTGAAGFLGSHALRHLLVNTDWHLVCPVSFAHKGLPERIVMAVSQPPSGDVEPWWQRITVVRCDLACPINDTTATLFGPVDYIINYASQSHVDRSISDPAPFVTNNFALMVNLLEYARTRPLGLFVQISTDEVYGSPPVGTANREWDPIIPSNPYSASKAAQEALAISYWRTYHLPLTIVNCFDMNTRVMTSSDGPKAHADLAIGDQVWALNDEGEMVLEPVLGLMRTSGPERMIRIDAKGSSQLVTPDHRIMLVREYGKPRRLGSIEETPAGHLIGMKGRARIPRNGSWAGNDDATIRPYEHFAPQPHRRDTGKRIPLEMPTEQVAELFGWFLSEGNVTSTQVRITQKSAFVRDRIVRLLDGVDGQIGNKGDAVYISNGHLADFLSLCGGSSQTTYRIPRFIKDLSPKYLRILFDALVDGDGTRYGDGCVYYTKSYRLAADVCEIGMKLGYAARISERETWDPRKTRRSKSWIARLTPAQGTIEARNVSTESYDGDVWCLRVPSGRVFIEREGIISLSGQCMNLIGEMQDPEKFVPNTIGKVSRGEMVDVHASPTGVLGSRHYLHARNLADAVLFLIRRGQLARYPRHLVPDRWNVVGEREIDNLEMAQLIADMLAAPLHYQLVDFHSYRPGHDLRYALDGTKLAATGWTMPIPLEDSLRTLVKWTVEHPLWANRRASS